MKKLKTVGEESIKISGKQVGEKVNFVWEKNHGGERGRRAKEDALEELRKLANQWLLTVAEKKRRRLIGPNGDRNARGRHFYSNLRSGTILSEAALDDLLAQSHRDSAKGIRSSVNRPPSAVVPPTPRSQNKSSATPTPAQPSGAGAGADATPLSSRPNLSPPYSCSF